MRIRVLLILLLALAYAVQADVPPNYASKEQEEVASTTVDAGRVEAQLVAEHASIQPGVPAWIALRLTMDPHWHVYWKNPGEAGLAVRVDWDVPAGVHVGDIAWPYPHWIDVGGLANFGYEGEVLLLAEVRLASDADVDDALVIRAKARWLVCEEICVPEQAELELSLPVKDETPQPLTEWSESFASTREMLPLEDAGWNFEAYRRDGRLIVEAVPPDGAAPHVEDAIFFPDEEGVINYAEGQSWTRGEGRYEVSIVESKLVDEPLTEIGGVLVSDTGWLDGDTRKALRLSAKIVEREPIVVAASEPSDVEAPIDVGGILWLAYLGGLILNLMPCVFPVLGLKIVGFVQQAGESRGKVTLHGIMFTLGVLVSFWMLAGVLIAVRQGGSELGWGFQLQSPIFVFILTVILFVFALNLSGLFEAGLALTRVGGATAKSSGLTGSFFSGALATVVATPCAAPFLAPALGAALALEPRESLYVFTIIALGLATPYLFLSIFPGLVRLLPKPGAWMESFKQFMAFLLYATVAYLVWVLAGQLDERGFLFILFALVSFALAAWIYGRWCSLGRSGRARAMGLAMTCVVALGGGALAYTGLQPSDVKWETWSPARVQELREQGRPVYVDFTARWCATCQVNKRVALSAPDVIAKFKKEKVALLKADWTNADPEITRALAEFGRSAVPFNILYLPKKDDPVILQEVLTPRMVLDALARIDAP